MKSRIVNIAIVVAAFAVLGLISYIVQSMKTPEPTADWAKAIGQLMQSKSSITRIVIETGDKSRILFKKP